MIWTFKSSSKSFKCIYLTIVMNTITFDSDLKEKIISKALNNKEVNEEGFIIDSSSREEVLSPDGTPVNIEDFGLFENGSEVFIKNDIISLMEYSNLI